MAKDDPANMVAFRQQDSNVFDFSQKRRFKEVKKQLTNTSFNFNYPSLPKVKFSLYSLIFQVILLCVFSMAWYSKSIDASYPENGISMFLGGNAGRKSKEQIVRDITFLVTMTDPYLDDTVQ